VQKKQNTDSLPRALTVTPHDGPVEIRGDAEPGVLAHGMRWIDGDVHSPIGARWMFRPWSFTMVTGEKLTAGCDRIGLSPFQYFMATFPTQQLILFVVETNIQLEKKRKLSTSPGELLKLFGFFFS
jgi:hypothetical protein